MFCILALAGCADPIAQQTAREDARLKVLGGAVFYWRCAHQPVVQAGECQEWTDAYARDRAAFISKYGDGKN